VSGSAYREGLSLPSINVTVTDNDGDSIRPFPAPGSSYNPLEHSRISYTRGGGEVTGLPSGLTFTATGNNGFISGTPGLDAAGTYTINIKVVSDHAANGLEGVPPAFVDEETFTLTIKEAPPTILSIGENLAVDRRRIDGTKASPVAPLGTIIQVAEGEERTIEILARDPATTAPYNLAFSTEVSIDPLAPTPDYQAMSSTHFTADDAHGRLSIRVNPAIRAPNVNQEQIYAYQVAVEVHFDGDASILTTTTFKLEVVPAPRIRFDQSTIGGVGGAGGVAISAAPYQLPAL